MQKPAYPALQHLHTQGKFYDVGYNVGVTFSKNIQLFLARSHIVQGRLLPFYDSYAGRTYFDESLKVSQQCFPQYVHEIQGMAQGAGVLFEHMFMLNISPEAYALQSEAKSSHTTESTVGESTTEGHECSTVLINNIDMKLHIHNEDSDPAVKPYGYLLSADIEEDGIKEQFTAFCYPGTLPGRAFAFNVHGLTISVNALAPLKVTRGAPSRLFLHRAVLGGRDVHDVCSILENAGYGAAYGFCTSLCTADKEMFSIELAPGKPKATLNVLQLPEQKDSNTSSHYFHFNHYQQLMESVEERACPGSLNRAKRALEFPAPINLQDALVILSDEKNSMWPIFRSPSKADAAETVATVVFDVVHRLAQIYQGKSSDPGNKPIYTLPMFR